MGVTGYEWRVDGARVDSSAVDTLVHRFAADGTYSVTLVVSDSASQTGTLSQDVTVRDSVPEAAFTVSCDALACVFDGSASRDDHGIETYAWSVDGTAIGSAATATFSHTFAGAGTYSVRLEVTDGAMQTADSTRSVTVPVDRPPTALFDAVCVGRECVFDGSGSTDDVGVTGYEWRVDGARVDSSAVDSLVHRFAADDTYSVTLVVSDSASQTGTLSRDVTVSDGPPEAAFTYSCTNRECAFDGTTSTDDVGIASYRWSIEEGVQSTEVSTASTFTHTFDSDGTWEVTLRVEDTAVPAQSDSETQAVVIGSQPPPPPPEPPEASVTARCRELACDFDGSASSDDAGITSYTWHIDGVEAAGSASTRSDTFPSAGTYTVRLTVADAAGLTDSDSVTVAVSLNPDPDLDITSCSELTCTLDGSGSTDDAGIASYTWYVDNVRVGAGPASSRRHTFGGAGTYAVRLTVADIHGNTASDTGTADVSRGPAADLDVSCDELECTLDGSGSRDDIGIVSYAWYVDNSLVGSGTASSRPHTFQRAGTYTVRLTVADRHGNTDSDSRPVTVTSDEPPTAILSVSCGGLDCTFDGSDSDDDDRITNYAWEVNGSEIASGAASSVDHTFAGNGTYSVTLTVEDTADPVQTDSDTQSVTVRDDPPVARFTYSCDANRTCDFDGSGSTDDVEITSYTWSVLEGPRSVGGATGATFSRTFGYGTWRVTLGVADKLGQTGSASETLDFPEPDSVPVARLTVSCDELECTFGGSGSSDDNGIESYTWEVDGTQVATGASSSVDHTFGSAGTYSVSLTVADSAGQTDSDSESVTVVSDEDPSAILSVSCTGLDCTFGGSNSTDDHGITNYTWEVTAARSPRGRPVRRTTRSPATGRTR